MMFEFDKNKNESNIKKHGIDFESARELWDDPDRIVIPARCLDEPRYLLIGMIGPTCWSAVFVERENTIRIISVRRSRQNEKELYQSG
jgi:uncharacterized protein